MHERSRPCWLTLGLILGCGPVPGEVMGGSASGSTGATGNDATTMNDRPSASTSGVAGSGDATGLPGTTAAEGETTQGAGPGTTGPGTTGPSESTGPSDSDSTSDSSSSTGPPPTCDELYGAAPGYLLCMETDTECHFNATTNGGNCNTMCSMLMGTCIDAFDNGDGCDLNRGVDDDCTTNRSTEVCVCSRSA